MRRASIIAFPWDLLDGDLEGVLDQLHGEIGATGVSAWMASPPRTQLRLRDRQPRVFRTRGGLFFRPDPARYAATRCKPVVSSWVKSKRPLKRLADACLRRGMELRVIVSAAATGRLARHHPEMACKNVLGAPSHVSLCLSNPDVVGYLSSLMVDLSSRPGLAGVAVTDLAIGWAEAFGADLHCGPGVGETERLLLALCFCESCCQGAADAGVDVAAARRSVHVLLQQSLDRGTPMARSLDALLVDHEPLAAYHRWHAGTLSSVLKRLVEACTCELLLDRPSEGCPLAEDDELDLSPPAAVITPLNHPDGAAPAWCPAARRNELRLSASLAVGPHAQQLVRTVARAVELGFSGVEIDHYGLLSDAALTAARQAIRFARRTTTG